MLHVGKKETARKQQRDSFFLFLFRIDAAEVSANVAASDCFRGEDKPFHDFSTQNPLWLLAGQFSPNL